MRQKITYESLGLFVSDPTGWRQDQNLELINLVQNASFDFSINRQQVKEIGNHNLHLNQSYSAPTVNLNFQYLMNQSFLNEKKLGLHRFEGECAFSKFDPKAFDDRNLIFLVSAGNFEELQFSQNYTGYDTIAFGNCFLTNYNMSAGVGQLTTVSAGYECANMEFYTYGANNAIPAVNLTGGHQSGIGNFQVVDTGMSDTNYYMSQRLGLMIDNIYEGGAKLTGNQGQQREAYIQNFNLGVNIPRKELLGLGSNHFYNKKIQFPLDGTLSMSVILDEYTSGNFDDIYSNDKTYDFTLRVFPPDQSQQLLAEQNQANFDYTIMTMNDGTPADAQSFTVQRKSLFQKIQIAVADHAFNTPIFGKNLSFDYKLYEGEGLEGRLLQSKSKTFNNVQAHDVLDFDFDEVLAYRGEKYTFAFKWANPTIDTPFDFGFTYKGFVSTTTDVYTDGKFYNDPDFDNDLNGSVSSTSDLMFSGIGMTPLPIFYRIHDAKLDSHSFSYQIGGFSTADLNFSFQITPETGLEIY